MTEALKSVAQLKTMAEVKSAPPAERPRPLKERLPSMARAVKAALPAVMTPERFLRVVQSALSSSAMLQQCTPESFFGAMMTAAQLGLEPNTPLGHAYLIPYRNGRERTVECQFQLGYKGLIVLADRAGVSVNTEVVREHDEFEYELGTHRDIRHRPARGDRGPAAWYYATWRKRDGSGEGFAVMSVEEMQAHANRYSKAKAGGKPSPWETNFDEMAKKTVLKRALKLAPLSVEFQRGIASDAAVRDWREGLGIEALDTQSKRLGPAADFALPEPPIEGEAEYVETPAEGEAAETPAEA